MRKDMANDVVFLLDVDNTLLDNDRAQNGLMGHLEREFGAANRDRYVSIFDAQRIPDQAQAIAGAALATPAGE